jgi:hypothetical protein
LCYFHRESQAQRVKVCGENGKKSGQVLVPVFEDATSIQMMVRQVTMLVLEGKIDNKRAGLVLYALQTASSNLKRMAAEKPRPVQVVVEPGKVAETPLGMTPWSTEPEGHESEEAEDPVRARTKKAILAEWEQERRNRKAVKMREQLDDLKRWAELEIAHLERERSSQEKECLLSGMRKDFAGVIESINGGHLISELEWVKSRRSAQQHAPQA